VNFVLVTGSRDKAREAAQILGRDLETRPMELPEIQAATAGEVARDKARQAFAALGRACVVEDAALELRAWGGMPGPFVKWFERAAGLPALCRSLDAFSDRSAEAVCVLALATASGIVTAEGRLSGTIARAPAGGGGFGWDAIFVPDGHARTFAQMRAGEKNAISHRRRAWEALRERLVF
jgi:non-canonical purine NTP pyrophosphatase (RdgB/HAM1 family)